MTEDLALFAASARRKNASPCAAFEAEIFKLLEMDVPQVRIVDWLALAPRNVKVSRSDLSRFLMRRARSRSRVRGEAGANESSVVAHPSPTQGKAQRLDAYPVSSRGSRGSAEHMRSENSPGAAPYTFEFFHRVEGLYLKPGNKTAGFVGVVSTEALRALRGIQVTEDQVAMLLAEMQVQLVNAKLATKRAASGCGVVLIESSACPRLFVNYNVGAHPSSLERLSRPVALESIGPTTEFTPHNVETPAQALALLVMFETWAEWALRRLRQHAQSEAAAASA